MSEKVAMRKGILIGMFLLTTLAMLGLFLGLLAPYYNSVVASIAEPFSSKLVDVTVDEELIKVVRGVDEGSGPGHTATTNGYLLQLSYLVLIGMAFMAWRAGIKGWQWWGLATIPLIIVAHVFGIWIDGHAVANSELWVQLSRMVTFSWAVLPAMPLMAVFLLERGKRPRVAKGHHIAP
jgi:hypothetical protein